MTYGQAKAVFPPSGPSTALSHRFCRRRWSSCLYRFFCFEVLPSNVFPSFALVCAFSAIFLVAGSYLWFPRHQPLVVGLISVCYFPFLLPEIGAGPIQLHQLLHHHQLVFVPLFLYPLFFAIFQKVSFSCPPESLARPRDLLQTPPLPPPTLVRLPPAPLPARLLPENANPLDDVTRPWTPRTSRILLPRPGEPRDSGLRPLPTRLPLLLRPVVVPETA